MGLDMTVPLLLMRGSRPGTKELFIHRESMVALLQHVMRCTTEPRVSLNRPQYGGKRLVHRLEWSGVTFVAVSDIPILVV